MHIIIHHHQSDVRGFSFLNRSSRRPETCGADAEPPGVQHDESQDMFLDLDQAEVREVSTEEYISGSRLM
jgi:hypothetical protein